MCWLPSVFCIHIIIHLNNRSFYYHHLEVFKTAINNENCNIIICILCRNWYFNVERSIVHEAKQTIENAAALDECEIRRNISQGTIEITQALFFISEDKQDGNERNGKRARWGQCLLFGSSHFVTYYANLIRDRKQLINNDVMRTVVIQKQEFTKIRGHFEVGSKCIQVDYDCCGMLTRFGSFIIWDYERRRARWCTNY